MRLALPWFTPSPPDPCFCMSGRTFGECCGLESDDREPPAGVHLFPGFLDEATCAKWVKRLENKPRKRSSVHKIKNARNRALSTEDNPVRVCRDVNPGVLRKVISDRVVEAFRRVTSETGDTVEWFESPSILRYQSGGFFLGHADSCLLDPANNTWFKVKDRDLSLLIYLNEDFTGGGLSFLNFNYHLKPSTGDMLVFPSDNRYIHQAEVVESGFRYVIVSWAALRGSQRVSVAPPAGAIHLPSEKG